MTIIDEDIELEGFGLTDRPTIEELLLLWRATVIGTLEFRNWLEELYPSFKKARRADVDEYMQKKADKMAEEQDLAEEDELELEVSEEV